MKKFKYLLSNKLFKSFIILAIIITTFNIVILPGLEAKDNLLNAISVVLFLITMITAGWALDTIIDQFTEN